MKIIEIKFNFWPRLLFGLSPLFIGAVGVHKNIIDIIWLLLCIILSALLYKAFDSSIELHEDKIELKGLMFLGTVRELRLDKIQFIDTVSNVGTYIFRIGFDSSLARGAFWQGTDNVLLLSPVFFRNIPDSIKEIMRTHTNIHVDSRTQESLNRKDTIAKLYSELFFGGVSIALVLGMFLILEDKF